jgi:hypothetical protein
MNSPMLWPPMQLRDSLGEQIRLPNGGVDRPVGDKPSRLKLMI